MCYVMHIGAVEALKLRATPYLIEKYLKKVKDGFIGTLSYSDPETGSHFWYPIASGARKVDGGYEVLKKASWTTSAGFADFYVCQTTSPDYNGDYSNLSVFVIDKDQIVAETQEWDAMGLRGNQSGSLLCDWGFVPDEQLVGPIGDGANSNDEAVDPYFLIGSSGVWNGIALGAIDIAVRHTTRKTHKDVGLRVADYPTIQDAVGEAIMDTNARRLMCLSVAQACDNVTDGAQKNPRRRRARARQLPALAVADQVRGGQERRGTSSTRCCTAAAAPATRSSRCSSSASSATARPAGSWARPTRCCGSSSARRPCSAWPRSTTGTRSSTSARSTTSSRSSRPSRRRSSPSDCSPRPEATARADPRTLPLGPCGLVAGWTERSRWSAGALAATAAMGRGDAEAGESRAEELALSPT